MVGFNEKNQKVSRGFLDDNLKPPKLQLKRLSPNTNVGLRKSQIQLSDYGVTFDKYKAELERGITHGYKPHFGYPTLKFNDVMEGLSALNCEDSSGSPDPIMQIVNSDSITKFQNLLLASGQAGMQGNKMVIEPAPKSLYNNCWLYNFIQQTEKRNVSELVVD